MSDITTAIQSILADVTVDSNGVVSMTRNALATYLGLARHNFYGKKMSPKIAEILTGCGFDDGKMFAEAVPLPDTAIALIIQHYALDSYKASEYTREKAKQTLLAFAAIGIRKFFQQAKGWEETKPKSKADTIKELIDIATRYHNIECYVTGKPGMEIAVQGAEDIRDGSKLLPGKFTLNEYLESKGIEMPRADKCSLGMYLATLYRNMYGESPEKRRVRYRRTSGQYQYLLHNTYPTDFLPMVETARLGFETL